MTAEGSGRPGTFYPQRGPAPLRIGTRGSKLALAQAGLVKEALERAHPGLVCELVTIRTSGDAVSAGEKPETRTGHNVPGTELRSDDAAAMKGLFVKELEEALLEGKVDLAVHSAKDMETDLASGLAVAAVLKREDPRDALVARNGGGLKTLAAGAKMGVSSLRRAAQLKRLRRDLEFVEVRGNVDTRLRKLEEGQADALVLAAAGLIRLGLGARISESLDPAQFLPAPCQGALALEARADRADVAEAVKPLEDAGARAEFEAERALLKALGGNCRVPVGALARTVDGNLTLEAVVLSPDGLKAVRKSVSGSRASAARLGRELASHLRAAGADRLLYGQWNR
ncbi:MAG: hydroxymethylbilane synthase [Candidatus Omnitrophica bacterium]|nr:hydroxymethylbilane synthase [Candidatus Omnitrophota bacterium]